MNDSVKIKGQIDWKIIRANGDLEEGSINNLIVSAGKAAIAGLVGNTGSISAFTYLELGTSSTAVNVAQTTLAAAITTNNIGRASATITRTTTTVTNDTLTLTKTWSPSGTSIVEEIGVFNASSSGIMLGRALTGTKNLANGDTFVTTYNIIFS